MTKTLTEQWKNGELGFGYYYIDFGIGGVPMLFNGLEFYCERTQKPNAIKTILAPVPSYDEWKKLDDELKELATMNDMFAIENGRLRERLVIAKKALVDILNDGDDYWDKDKAQEALAKMEGVK